MAEVREMYTDQRKPRFEIKSGTLKTSVYTDQGVDLVVEQKPAKGPKSYIKHYSDPGYTFYGCLIKFFHKIGHEIPKPPEILEKISDQYIERYMEERRVARSVVPDLEYSPMPFLYQHGKDGGSDIEVSHTGIGTKDPKLVFTQLYGKKEKITLDVETVKELINTIPRLYPTHYGFRSLHEELGKEGD